MHLICCHIGMAPMSIVSTNTIKHLDVTRMAKYPVIQLISIGMCKHNMCMPIQFVKNFNIAKYTHSN